MAELWKVYLRDGIVIIPTTANAGYYMDIDPVTVVPVSDQSGIISALKSTIGKGNPQMRPYLRSEFPPPVVLRPAGVKTWSAFEKKALGWIITLRDGIFEVCPQMKNPKGRGWVDDLAKVERLPSSSSIDDVAEIVAALILKAGVN
jgi:hypothetical protein